METFNNNCSYPKNRIWQWKDNWFCCKCWYRELGKYTDSDFSKLKIGTK